MSSACRLVGDNWWIGGSGDVVLQYSDDHATISQTLDIRTARALGAALLLRADELERALEQPAKMAWANRNHAGNML